tara:strand:+ start:104 stop:229 length:126 start_codon:yes stop_codon:yes gene_type:complete
MTPRLGVAQRKRKRKVMLEKRGLRRSDERENVFLVKVLNSF